MLNIHSDNLKVVTAHWQQNGCAVTMKLCVLQGTCICVVDISIYMCRDISMYIYVQGNIVGAQYC